jgi:hypothetical protein
VIFGQRTQVLDSLIGWAGAIADVRKIVRLHPQRLPPILDDPIRFPADEIASAVAEMRASGAYDQDVARGAGYATLQTLSELLPHRPSGSGSA